MAPAVAEQALWFVWALGMGAGLALLYDFLRELRRLCPRATVPADYFFWLSQYGRWRIWAWPCVMADCSCFSFWAWALGQACTV